ncbi:hypothetical protein ACIBG8_24000 [Nonomuraea sp. NPDC050556]|uniref:hypothetical protein n=1 Tax=Nonomuraea sp. NPDC050556 TaxID=3364369 RepID=UPI00378772CC
MGRSDSFPAFVAEHADHLARTGYLLTGDQEAARALAVRAVTSIGRRWPALRHHQPAGLALREVYRAYLESRAPVAEGFALAGLSPVGRAALVAQYHDLMPPHVAAEVCGLFHTLRQETALALAQVEAAGSPSLARLAAEPPPVELGEEVYAPVRRRRRIRVALAAAGATVLATAVVGAVTFGAVLVADQSSELKAVFPIDETEEDVPEALPAALTDPVAYAYTGYCVADGGECAQWRLVTTSGEEWRVADARHDTLGIMHVSQDGTRIAYLSTKDVYEVRDLPTGVTKKIGVRIDGTDPHFVSSPNGRFFGVTFGDADGEGGVLDFARSVSTFELDAKVVAIRNDGRQVTSERRNVDDVPGHAAITSFSLADGPAYRIDPALVEYGAALAPDGHTLALITDDHRLVRMDARNGRIARTRPVLDADTDEVDSIERWLGANELLVRMWDDENAVLAVVNVTTGQSRPYPLDGDDEIYSSATLGKLD